MTTYSLKHLYSIANGDNDFFNEMIDIFIQTTQEGIVKIKNSFLLKEWENVANHAHKIVSGCAYFEAHELVDLLKEIETKSRNQKELESLSDLILRTEEKTSQLILSLSKVINTTVKLK